MSDIIGAGGWVKRVFLISLVLQFYGSMASAGNQEPFDLGCLSWEQVTQEYDLSLLNTKDKTDLRRSHQAARNYLSNTEHIYHILDEQERRHEQLILCALIEEATWGFEKNCAHDSGEDFFSAELIDTCQSMRFQESPSGIPL